MNSSIEIIQREEMIYSDGWRCEFKNEYKNKYMHHFDKKMSSSLYLNYFATSHGKGVIDGIGGEAKSIAQQIYIMLLLTSWLNSNYRK